MALRRLWQLQGFCFGIFSDLRDCWRFPWCRIFWYSCCRGGGCWFFVFGGKEKIGKNEVKFKKKTRFQWIGPICYPNSIQCLAQSAKNTGIFWGGSQIHQVVEMETMRSQKIANWSSNLQKTTLWSLTPESFSPFRRGVFLGKPIIFRFHSFNFGGVILSNLWLLVSRRNITKHQPKSKDLDTIPPPRKQKT